MNWRKAGLPVSVWKEQSLPPVPHTYFNLRFAASEESTQHFLETAVDSWVLELVCKAVKVVVQLAKASFREGKQSKAEGQVLILAFSSGRDRESHQLSWTGLCKAEHILPTAATHQHKTSLQVLLRLLRLFCCKSVTECHGMLTRCHQKTMP